MIQCNYQCLVEAQHSARFAEVCGIFRAQVIYHFPRFTHTFFGLSPSLQRRLFKTMSCTAHHQNGTCTSNVRRFVSFKTEIKSPTCFQSTHRCCACSGNLLAMSLNPSSILNSLRIHRGFFCLVYSVLDNADSRNPHCLNVIPTHLPVVGQPDSPCMNLSTLLLCHLAPQ